ncbi:gliding motility-associated ABC transporter substrate-binding protein GldG [Flavobacterium sp. DG1-102-2]|uniref:gliding motility-associated ABC transporter substrate-binding protein GldG n=1 Tax=Flavobacterium sp. DG1-102-2 TaxID=3081663 RepID=UPI00294929A4|nr:gliding motility-associated ABC transporter substrate-binding protein GldG [Flavobacterium sp. DG1-102-2]MDV6166974.1 gliding motility-associated ABC transporter substrate-binding protein GldG [Flavobacterium sp. DG1-102-2]
METGKQKNLKQLLLTAIVLLVLNFAGIYYFKRFDLTHDKRYTLSPTTLSIVEEVQEPLYIDVFLEGDFPGEFKRLQDETRQLLEEFHARNSNIIFNFTNPLADEKTRDQAIQELYKMGMTPISVTVDDKGKQSQEVVFPWAMVNYEKKTVKLPLLKNMLGASTAEKVVSSVQHLEYAITEAINKVTKEKEKKVAIIKGNGEMNDRLMGDFIKTVRESYFIAPFTLDSVAKDPERTLKQLKGYDLTVIAKPTEAFTEQEKQVIDQYIVAGGKTLWMIDAVQIEMDSLYNSTGSTLAFPKDLNLNDIFFKYGFRINPDLVKDEMATRIKLASGAQGSETQYQEYPWKFSPYVYPDSDNPIVKNMSGIRFEFANGIDILKNDIKKTVLLKSSPYSKKIGTPVEVKLEMVSEEGNPKDYIGKGSIPVAVLLEGKFHSAFENRVLPFKDPSYKKEDKAGQMIVISDGDIIKNQLDKEFQPMELGYDKWTGNLYDNKGFIMNCVNYLLDDKGLINIRSKDVDLPMLDVQKVHDNYSTAQFITVGLPIVILALFGVLFTYLRKRKYSK